ncbi:helix-turn-helix domain-containing protein [Streptomyces sp. NPDC048603]|uniref:helix-turn-helix domain-containing protein n=1 Tax=Streptomyces sp. NPDC048603 TaxID=3365577 RepID=UPI003722D0E5
MVGIDELVRVKDEESFTAALAKLIAGHLAKGASLAGLARRAGVSENSLANWRGGVIPREEQLERLLAACHRHSEARAWAEARRRALQARTARQAALQQHRDFDAAQEALATSRGELEQALAELGAQRAAAALAAEEADGLRQRLAKERAEAERLRAEVAATAAREAAVEAWAREWPPFPFVFQVPETRTVVKGALTEYLYPGGRYVAAGGKNGKSLYLDLVIHPASYTQRYTLRNVSGIITDRTLPAHDT